MKATAKIDGEYLKIYLIGILHVAIKHKDLSVQSWIEGRKEKWYFVELTSSDNINELMKYDSVDTWKSILNAIDKIIK